MTMKSRLKWWKKQRISSTWKSWRDARVRISEEPDRARSQAKKRKPLTFLIQTEFRAKTSIKTCQSFWTIAVNSIAGISRPPFRLRRTLLRLTPKGPTNIEMNKTTWFPVYVQLERARMRCMTTCESIIQMRWNTTTPMERGLWRISELQVAAISTRDATTIQSVDQEAAILTTEEERDNTKPRITSMRLCHHRPRLITTTVARTAYRIVVERVVARSSAIESPWT